MRSIPVLIALLAFNAPTAAQQFVPVPADSAPLLPHVGVPAQIDYFSTGQAFADVDHDGLPDLFVTSSGGENRLLRNLGDGRFEDWSIGEALRLPQHASGGALFFDHDNDGWPDLLVLGLTSMHLFRNLGGAGFEDITAAAGLAGRVMQGQSAAAGDVDGDGLLDLYIVAWMDIDHPNAIDRLLRQSPSGGFEDWSQLLSAGVRGRPGFAVSMLDLDDDGDLDIYVVNDKQVGNALWRNDGPGCGGWCFAEVAAAVGAQRPVFGMGLAHGDIDHDGDLDLYFSSIDEQVLLRNDSTPGALRFTEISATSGTTFQAIGWGAEFFDADLDGHHDLYLCTMNAASTQANRLFKGLGDGGFIDVSAASGADDAGASIGLAFADFDRDGRIDLAVGNWRDRYRLYRNTSPVDGRSWVGLQLVGAPPINRDAIGAQVRLVDSLGRLHRRDVRAGSGMGGGSETALLIGLGDAVPAYASVRWPDGGEQFLALETGRYQRVDYAPQPMALMSNGFEAAP